jgi:hypothetical protein
MGSFFIFYWFNWLGLILRPFLLDHIEYPKVKYDGLTIFTSFPARLAFLSLPSRNGSGEPPTIVQAAPGLA